MLFPVDIFLFKSMFAALCVSNCYLVWCILLCIVPHIKCIYVAVTDSSGKWRHWCWSYRSSSCSCKDCYRTEPRNCFSWPTSMCIATQWLLLELRKLLNILPFVVQNFHFLTVLKYTIIFIVFLLSFTICFALTIDVFSELTASNRLWISWFVVTGVLCFRHMRLSDHWSSCLVLTGQPFRILRLWWPWPTLLQWVTLSGTGRCCLVCALEKFKLQTGLIVT